uniref:MI domain-containing protein n=1 Tax=Leptobrachium leishanense TaxID=445787 RepID=A0A8C5PZY8_9ANUR
MSNSAAMGPGEDNAVDEEMSEEVVPRDWTPQEKALHEAKLKAKAKYRIRRTSSRDSESNETHSEAPVPPGRSHDRKSRMGKGRGLPKKGGAGGKGVWGAPGQVYSYQEPDMQDPNYDESAQGDTVYQKVVPELDELGLQRNVQPTVQEFFEHGDTGEVIALLKELNLGRQTPGVPRLAMSLALEGKASHRELTSRLLSDLVGKVLSEEDNAEAFDRMLSDLPDLILDTPEAPQMLGQFIARAVADHALPLDFLDRYKGRVDCDHARAALDRAAVLLRIKREIIRLDNVWGVGGGQRPVKHLIKEVTWMDFLLCVGARRSLHAALSARGALCTRSLWTLDFVGMIPMAHSVLLSACSDLRLSGSPSLYCRTLTIICSLVLLQEHRILHLNCFTITDPLKMAAVTSDLCHPGAEPLVKVIAHV